MRGVGEVKGEAVKEISNPVEVGGAVETRGAAEVKVEVKPEVVESAEKQVRAQPSKVTTPKSQLKPLLSFSSLMAGELPQDGEEVEARSVEQSAEPLEADYPERLLTARESILTFVASWRPRFVATFESMSFERGGIVVAVPTTELQEEILRAKTELLTKVVEIAKIRGKIELTVEVNETIRASRPIRLEDRVAHITKANPLVDELRRRLDLMVE